ncbi:hypothetical protein PHJA_000011100 [Phtheirospermum japonicum]|uniref:DUF641 domain-containing protein n=1 Tax=Phtheirospermum japonicum TaxID=374723 RepID=A0A830B344_9LAMI|nr:hypothetical protein PHJA_000011100 [Phtheirospermum japonicum]
MDSVNHSALTPRKTKLAHTFAKALRMRLQNNTKHHQITKKDQISPHIFNKEAFLAKLFANISTVKAAYAQLQSAQSPYDADEIQSADQIIVSELKTISELKKCYHANQTLDETTSSLLTSEIKELNSLLITYRLTTKKLDSQLKLKDSEITFLKEKLAEANSDNDLLEARLLNLSAEVLGLSPARFIAYFHQAEKSIRSFVRLLMSEMEFAGWDLELAANSIQPGINSNHICYAFESFVCREMFDGFNYPNFSVQTERKSKCATSFCRDKYLRLMRPKMEKSIFGNLDQRNLVSGSGDFFPETPFLSAFCEMAKHIWLLHCLASSFNNDVSIFQVSKETHFSEVYMESLNDEAFFVSSDASIRVGFTVVPGFRIGKTVVQCQVYLR